MVFNLVEELNLLGEFKKFLDEIPLSLNKVKAERLLSINQSYLEKFDISIDENVITPYDFAQFTFY